MKKNIGPADKVIRVLLAIVVSVLYFTGVISGTTGIVLLAAGGILLATVFIDFCPIWAIFGINTRGTKAKQ